MWNFNEFSANLAAVDENERISYAELQERGDALAEQIGERCLCFVLCTNTISSLVGYTGLVRHGIVPLLLDAQIDSELLDSLIKTYAPKFLWAPIENASGYQQTYTDNHYALLKCSDKSYPMHDELSLLLTTSGSTGSPKLVRQSERNIFANARSIAEYLELDSTERPITTLPMNYTYGLSIINSHLLVGAAILMTSKSIMQKEFWQFFKENGATSFGGVPYTYEILKKLRFFKMDIPSLRTMTQAGGKLTPELHKEFAEYAIDTGRHFYVMYGQTEATARMSYLPYQRSLEKYGSMGIAIPGGRFQLIDVDGGLIQEPDVVGELVYYGDNVTLGYAERGEELLKGDERLGKLVTGDMAKMDNDGYFYIVGRKKRFLKIYGNRVNLDETERMIKAKFECDCASVGVDDKMTVYVSGYNMLDDVKAFLSQKTGLNPVAFVVKSMDAIPKNESGKTLYTSLEV